MPMLEFQLLDSGFCKTGSLSKNVLSQKKNPNNDLLKDFKLAVST